jgi:hypothetical protein
MLLQCRKRSAAAVPMKTVTVTISNFKEAIWFSRNRSKKIRLADHGNAERRTGLMAGYDSDGLPAGDQRKV